VAEGGKPVKQSVQVFKGADSLVDEGKGKGKMGVMIGIPLDLKGRTLPAPKAGKQYTTGETRLLPRRSPRGPKKNQIQTKGISCPYKTNKSSPDKTQKKG